MERGEEFFQWLIVLWLFLFFFFSEEDVMEFGVKVNAELAELTGSLTNDEAIFAAKGGRARELIKVMGMASFGEMNEGVLEGDGADFVLTT